MPNRAVGRLLKGGGGGGRGGGGAGGRRGGGGAGGRRGGMVIFNVDLWLKEGGSKGGLSPRPIGKT